MFSESRQGPTTAKGNVNGSGKRLSFSQNGGEFDSVRAAARLPQDGEGSLQLEDATDSPPNQDGQTRDLQTLGEQSQDMRQASDQFARNAQEAPDECEEEKDEKSIVTARAAVLSKRQREEAARLAEQRKLFDNQKFRQGSAEPLKVQFQDDQICCSGNSMVWLNKRPEVNEEERSQSMHTFLPGVVCDDLPQPQAATVRSNHHEVECDFNADDEALMEEILNVGDTE